MGTAPPKSYTLLLVMQEHDIAIMSFIMNENLAGCNQSTCCSDTGWTGWQNSQRLAG